MAKIAFLFPGQGAQAVGMGGELDAELPQVKSLYDRAGEILGFDLRKVCFEGPAEALEATDVSQPAIFLASLAALEGLKQTDPGVVSTCAGAAGLSLGEYTALVMAGEGPTSRPGSRSSSVEGRPCRPRPSPPRAG